MDIVTIISSIGVYEQKWCGEVKTGEMKWKENEVIRFIMLPIEGSKYQAADQYDYIVNLMKGVRSTSPDHVTFYGDIWRILLLAYPKLMQVCMKASGIFESLHQSLHRQCQECITTDRGNFEQLL